ncbi:hypothetical protein EDC01DRAFT_631695 [Geopyxis carbonaria]|nr:hypothetical protein EDC01DRAFT_631695 [Geopyxis carbonaria]
MSFKRRNTCRQPICQILEAIEKHLESCDDASHLWIVTKSHVNRIANVFERTNQHRGNNRLYEKYFNAPAVLLHHSLSVNLTLNFWATPSISICTRPRGFTPLPFLQLPNMHPYNSLPLPNIQQTRNGPSTIQRYPQTFVRHARRAGGTTGIERPNTAASTKMTVYNDIDSASVNTSPQYAKPGRVELLSATKLLSTFSRDVRSSLRTAEAAPQSPPHQQK